MHGCPRATHGIVGWFAKIILSGISNLRNYCVIFIVYTQLTNMAADRIIQLGEQLAARGSSGETNGLLHTVML